MFLTLGIAVESHSQQFRGVSTHNAEGWNISHDDRASSDYGAVPDHDASQDSRSVANPDIGADLNHVAMGARAVSYPRGVAHGAAQRTDVVVDPPYDADIGSDKAVVANATTHLDGAATTYRHVFAQFKPVGRGDDRTLA